MKDLEEAKTKITQIIKRCGLQTKPLGLGVAPDALETMLQHTRWGRVNVLPGPLG